MSQYPSDYTENVLNKIKNHKEDYKTIKASFFERYMKKKCSPKKMYPNPEDEFSHENIGPSFEIIENYETEARHLQSYSMPIFSERIIVEKLVNGSFLIINGHHRWFAALRAGIKAVNIKIVNLVHAEDVERMLERSHNTKSVSFDFDEVILCSEKDNQATVKDTVIMKHIPERLRKGAPNIIHQLQEKGVDVWVYTSKYYSEEYINRFFSMYDLKIDGVINGFNDKRKGCNSDLKQAKEQFNNKYNISLHIDLLSVLYVNRLTKEYENYDIDSGKSWSVEITDIINETFYKFVKIC